jgi:hypothetical protein
MKSRLTFRSCSHLLHSSNTAYRFSAYGHCRQKLLVLSSYQTLILQTFRRHGSEGLSFHTTRSAVLMLPRAHHLPQFHRAPSCTLIIHVLHAEANQLLQGFARQISS